jgi:hypothetical protein
MDRTTLVHILDKFISASPDAKVCPKHKPKDPNGFHGRLWPNAEGTAILCGTCTYIEPVSNELVSAAVNFVDSDQRRPMGGMLDDVFKAGSATARELGAR